MPFDTSSVIKPTFRTSELSAVETAANVAKPAYAGYRYQSAQADFVSLAAVLTADLGEVRNVGLN